jgi:hypothetical protein
VGRSVTPERNNEQYGRQLEIAVENVRDEFEGVARVSPPEFDPAFIFRLRIEGRVDEDHWRRSGLTLLSEEPGDVVVLFSEDQLAEFERRIQEYAGQIPEGQKGPRYSWIASVTTEMSNWSSTDRIGRKLSQIEIDPEAAYSLDIEIWQLGEDEDVVPRMQQLRRYIERIGGIFLDQ